MPIDRITPQALAQALQSDAPPYVVDVRTETEHALARLEAASLIPMDEMTTRWDELPMNRDIVVMCHHGIRSMHVALWLENKGFDRLYNLTGGIDQWSRDVDSSVPRY